MTIKVLRLIHNDVSSLQQIHIMDEEIDEIHFEDTYQMHRLNKDPDIYDIGVHQLMTIIESTEVNYKPVTKATIRAMKSQVVHIKMQLDSGANRSVTPHKNLLHNVQQIQTMSIDGVGGTVSSNQVGYLKLTCHDDTYLWVKTYYCPQIEETIVSPSDIAMSQQNQLVAWEKYCNVVNGQGHLTFYTSSGIGKVTISILMRNGLGYTAQKLDNLHNR